MDPGMDTGDVLLARPATIGADETAGELSARLARLGADVIGETLDRLATLTPTPQDHASATLPPRLKKGDGAIDWTRPARDLVNLARGCNPWPGATAQAAGGALTICPARALRRAARRAPRTPVADEGALARLPV